MNPKLTRTILLALSLGFFVVWILEFRRTTLFESYWLLLLSLTSLLFFQFNRLKAAQDRNKAADLPQKDKTAKPVRK